jgi:hypothetical protein
VTRLRLKVALQAPNVSRLDPSGAVQFDAEHPAGNRKVKGSVSDSGTPRRPSWIRSRIASAGSGSKALAWLASQADGRVAWSGDYCHSR